MTTANSFFVSEVDYAIENESKHITRARLHFGQMLPDDLGNIVQRPEILKFLDRGVDGSTILKRAAGGWSGGVEIHIYQPDPPEGPRYIRTKGNDTESDNLENLSPIST